MEMNFSFSCLENSMDRGAWWGTLCDHKKLDMTEHVRAHTHTHTHTHTPYFSFKDRLPSAYLSINRVAGGGEGHWQDPCVRARSGKAA